MLQKILSRDLQDRFLFQAQHIAVFNAQHAFTLSVLKQHYPSAKYHYVHSEQTKLSWKERWLSLGVTHHDRAWEKTSLPPQDFILVYLPLDQLAIMTENFYQKLASFMASEASLLLVLIYAPGSRLSTPQKSYLIDSQTKANFPICYSLNRLIYSLSCAQLSDITVSFDSISLAYHKPIQFQKDCEFLGLSLHPEMAFHSWDSFLQMHLNILYCRSRMRLVEKEIKI